MSGIYIPGLAMPEDGWHKVIKIFSDGTVVSYYDSVELAKAIPVPDHGRLIDAGFLLAEYDKIHVGKPGGARLLIANAPTIIPADKEETE